MKKNKPQSKRDKIEAIMNAVPNTAALFYSTEQPPAGNPSETRKASPEVIDATLAALREKSKNAVRADPKKTRRVQLLMTPHLFEAVTLSAKMTGLSFNEYVARVLAAAVTADAV